jgi:sugar/nucleoside kinase (ribokinase family)
VRIPFTIPKPADHEFDVVGVGENSVDYIGVAAEPPTPRSKQPLVDFTTAPGGQIATAIVTCVRLGWRGRYIGAFGGDEAGRRSRDSLVQENVDVAFCTTIADAANRIAVILVDARSGERTILWHRDARLRIGVVPTAAATSGRLLLVDGEDVHAAGEAAATARRAGIPTIADVDEVTSGTDALLRQIDALIMSEDFPARLTGQAHIGRALEAIEREYGAALVCATLGAGGSLARCGGREIRTPPFPTACRDTTGAGDVFRGAFASACLQWPDGDVERVLAYANAGAAISCRGIGARGGLPAAREIDALLGL